MIQIVKKKYNVGFQEEVQYNVVIEADSKDEAEEKFIKGDYDQDKLEEIDGNMLDGSLKVEDVEEENIESKCPKCNKVLYPIDIDDYDFECLNCNKKFYSSEVK